jgi:hypothetical protein
MPRITDKCWLHTSTPRSAGIFDDKNLTPVSQQMPKTLLVYSLKKKLNSVLFTHPEVHSVKICLTEELTFHQDLFPSVFGLMTCTKA